MSELLCDYHADGLGWDECTDGQECSRRSKEDNAIIREEVGTMSELQINYKPEEISNFTATIEISIPVDEVIEIVQRHEVPGVQVAGFNKVDAIKEVRAKYGTGLRDSKQIVEAVMAQLGFPRHLG